MSVETLGSNVSEAARQKRLTVRHDRLWLLIVPMTLFFVVFFVLSGSVPSRRRVR